MSAWFVDLHLLISGSVHSATWSPCGHLPYYTVEDLIMQRLVLGAKPSQARLYGCMRGWMVVHAVPFGHDRPHTGMFK